MPRKSADIAGKRYGQIVILRRVPDRKRTLWLYRCDCGNEKAGNSYDIQSGKITSCGCAKSDRFRKILTKHGMAGSKELKSLKAAIQRCTNPNDRNYREYGSRGICVCERWLGEDGAVNFLNDMGARPEGHTLERKDVNGNYCPENCVWATRKQQARNKRNNRLLTAFGVTKTLSEWSEQLRRSRSTITRWIADHKATLEDYINWQRAKNQSLSLV